MFVSFSLHPTDKPGECVPQALGPESPPLTPERLARPAIAQLNASAASREHSQRQQLIRSGRQPVQVPLHTRPLAELLSQPRDADMYPRLVGGLAGCVAILASSS